VCGLPPFFLPPRPSRTPLPAEAGLFQDPFPFRRMKATAKSYGGHAAALHIQGLPARESRFHTCMIRSKYLSRQHGALVFVTLRVRMCRGMVNCSGWG